MAIFGADPSHARIASALERLVELYSLDLTSRGVEVEPSNLLGEIIDTDEAQIFATEQEEERKRVSGLAPGRDYKPTQPDGSPWPPDSRDASESPFFSSASYAWLGPEGAEAAFQGPPEVRREGE